MNALAGLIASFFAVFVLCSFGLALAEHARKRRRAVALAQAPREVVSEENLGTPSPRVIASGGVVHRAGILRSAGQTCATCGGVLVRAGEERAFRADALVYVSLDEEASVVDPSEPQFDRVARCGASAA